MKTVRTSAVFSSKKRPSLSLSVSLSLSLSLCVSQPPPCPSFSVPTPSAAVSVNGGVRPVGPWRREKLRGRLPGGRGPQGLIVTHRIKLSHSISFSVTQGACQEHTHMLTHRLTHSLTVSLSVSVSLSFFYSPGLTMSLTLSQSHIFSKTLTQAFGQNLSSGWNLLIATKLCSGLNIDSLEWFECESKNPWCSLLILKATSTEKKNSKRRLRWLNLGGARTLSKKSCLLMSQQWFSWWEHSMLAAGKQAWGTKLLMAFHHKHHMGRQSWNQE